jgi:hypothetical protein
MSRENISSILDAGAKRLIVWIAIRRLMPARLATWLINRFGLRGA